jgi:hypothetical protein
MRNQPQMLRIRGVMAKARTGTWMLDGLFTAP